MNIFSSFSIFPLLSPILVALVWILLFSFLQQPARQKLSAIMMAGAGEAYLWGGFGLWEFAACSIFTLLAYKGLADYRWIGIGWFLHTCWDVLHHLYGHSIVPFSASSSAGCAICDSVLAIWYFFGAHSFIREGRLSLSVRASGIR